MFADFTRLRIQAVAVPQWMPLGRTCVHKQCVFEAAGRDKGSESAPSRNEFILAFSYIAVDSGPVVLPPLQVHLACLCCWMYFVTFVNHACPD
jgi:hypothetical protein